MPKLLIFARFRRAGTFASLSTLLLGGCAYLPQFPQHSASKPAHLVAAKPVIAPPVVISPPTPTAPPQQLVKIHRHSAPTIQGTAATLRARAMATQDPKLSGYVNAVMMYQYEPGEVYKVDTSPGFITTIELQPGEKLVSMAAGDTQRWILGNTLVGTGPKQRVVILLKPLSPHLQTNVVVTTNKRVYMLDARSFPGDSYQSGISWTYPNQELRDLEQTAQQTTGQQSTVANPSLNLGNLDFGYHIKTVQGSKPSWFPQQVFNDGKKTYIRFPDDLSTTNAPPLFIVEHGNQVGLVNYRVKGDYYIVDRLFSEAELRYGQTPQTIVKITRSGAQ